MGVAVPVSELQNVPGVDYAGAFPAELQFMLPITHRDRVNALIADHIHRNTDFQGVHHAKLAA